MIKDNIRVEENIIEGIMPETRRKALKKIIKEEGFIRILEAHNGLTGLIVEKTKIHRDNEVKEFGGMWVSSLCDSTAKGKPDIELVDFTSRTNTINDIMEVTTKPIIVDGDTGGEAEHLKFTVKTLERLGVSAIVIEDKVGLKKNSLFGLDVSQTQASIEEFSNKISLAKKSLITDDFMIIARIESLILEKGIEDALESYYRVYTLIQRLLPKERACARLKRRRILSVRALTRLK